LVNKELQDDPQYASLPQKEKKAHQLSTYRRICANCWRDESDEVKAEIQGIFDEEHKEKADEEKADESEEDEDNNNNNNNDDDDDEKTLLQHQQEYVFLYSLYLYNC
jgi:hypothetical protein